jgi:hypothetical protein
VAPPSPVKPGGAPADGPEARAGMKPFGPPRRLNVWKDRRRSEEIKMKLRTRFAIFVLAAILSIAGFGVLMNGLSVDKVMTAATPLTEISVSVTG